MRALSDYLKLVLVIDLQADWKTHMVGVLRAMHYNVDDSESVRDIAITFFNVQRRRVDPRPRQVLESAEFQCPERVRDGYGLLKGRLIAGQDVVDHQGPRILKAAYKDGLFNDWGIRHFHLERTGDGGFRGDLLLYAYVTPECVYCINVHPHGEWTNQQLMRTLHRNWPEAIQHARSRRSLGLEHKNTDDDIAKLRAAHIVSSIEVEPGVVYGPAGGGYASDGTSITAVRDTLFYLRFICDMEKQIQENLWTYIDLIEKTGRSCANPARFALLINEHGFSALETTSQVAIPFTLPV